MRRIGMLGGSYDPVHRAHVEVAMSVLHALELDECRMLPCRQSPTRDAPHASGEHRLAMLQRATAGLTGIVVDDRELHRDGVSYSVDTLQSLRADYPDAALYMIVGSDAFNGLLDWHKWPWLFELAHIVVVRRPGEALVAQGELAEVLAQHRVDALPATRAGAIIAGPECELPFSSTAVRAAIKAGDNELLTSMLAAPVRDYIEENGLYQ